MAIIQAPPNRALSGESVTLLRSLLLCELAQQLQQAADQRESVEELTGRADSARAVDRELAEAAASHAEELIAEVRHALDRLEDGTFGCCEECGGSIDLARLEALPYTRRCLQCVSQLPRKLRS